MRLLVCSLFLAVAASAAAGQTPALTAAEASQHVGEIRTVCGQIATIFTASASHGTPTFVDIDQPWPHPIFNFVIWGDDKDTVGDFPKSGKVCASGRITLYRGRPEIPLTDWHSWYVPH